MAERFGAEPDPAKARKPSRPNAQYSRERRNSHDVKENVQQNPLKFGLHVAGDRHSRRTNSTGRCRITAAKHTKSTHVTRHGKPWNGFRYGKPTSHGRSVIRKKGAGGR